MRSNCHTTHGWLAKVLDRLPPPPAVDDAAAWSDTARFYLIGINARGEGALMKLGVWDDVAPYTAPVRGRKDWAPGAGPDGGVLTVRAERPPTRIIPRDRLVACLLKVRVRKDYSSRHQPGTVHNSVIQRNTTSYKQNNPVPPTTAAVHKPDHMTTTPR